MSLDEANSAFLSSRINELSNQVGDLAKLVHELNTKLSALESTVRDFGASSRIIDSRVLNLVETSATLNESLRSLRDEVGQLADNQEDHEAFVEEVRRHMQAAANTDTTIRAQQEKNIANITRLDNQREAMSKIMATHISHITNAKDQLKDLSTKVKTFEDSMNTIAQVMLLIKRVGLGVAGFIAFIASVQAIGGMEWVRMYLAKLFS